MQQFKQAIKYVFYSYTNFALLVIFINIVGIIIENITTNPIGIIISMGFQIVFSIPYGIFLIVTGQTFLGPIIPALVGLCYYAGLEASKKN